MVPLEFWLPRPFSANQSWKSRVAYNGGKPYVLTYRTEEYMDWLKECGPIAASQTKFHVDYPYKLFVTATRPNKKWDVDNILKPLGDFLQRNQYIKNDNLCEAVHARWVTNGDGVGVRIEKAITE